jgi:1,4-alpha-glucan branching enzyme
MSHGERTAADDLLDAVAAGRCDDPFAVLGRHRVVVDGRPALVIRTMQPEASDVQVVTSDRVYGMQRCRPQGVYQATVPLPGRVPEAFTYRFRVREGAATRDVTDPYLFTQVLTDVDLHLFTEGALYRAWERLGARRMTIDGTTGVHFAVWAPNAQRVSVVGDFNRWDGRVHPMRRLAPSGVWEVFVPELHHGARYKFELRTATGQLLLKADPYARWCEVPPSTASVIWTDEGYQWRDQDWMRERALQGEWRERPMAIYEVHVGSWRRVPEEGNRFQTYRELAGSLVPYVLRSWPPSLPRATSMRWSIPRRSRPRSTRPASASICTPATAARSTSRGRWGPSAC